MGKPLEGVKILDLTRVLAGPFSTMLLKELGAEIIKVEMPEKGDDSRGFGPFKNNKSVYFLSINHGKKSISVNMKSEQGKEIILDLVEKCDVVMENFSPGTMERLGFGYDVLKKRNPSIIYASTSGFGHTGPFAKRPSYDILAQAMGGVMSITGWPDSPPTRVGMSLGDINAALYTTIGVLGALYRKQMTGEGDRVDISMLDCQLSILENALIRYQVDGVSPEPIGNRHPTITPFQAFKAKDRYFVLGVGNEDVWHRLCISLNKEEWTKDPRFEKNMKRTQNLLELTSLLDEIFIEKNASEWVSLFESHNVPCSLINKVEDLFEHEQIKSRNMLVNVTDSDIGEVTIAGNAIKMDSIPEEKIKKPAPEIGEHNYEILERFLGYNKDKIDSLKEIGVL